MLVAPMFKSVEERDVYPPPGTWIDYQTGKEYDGGWHSIKAGEIPVVVLVKDGAVIPHIKLAQSTMDMDWSNIEQKVFSTTGTAGGMLYTPGAEKLEMMRVRLQDQRYLLVENPFGDASTFDINN